MSRTRPFLMLLTVIAAAAFAAPASGAARHPASASLPSPVPCTGGPCWVPPQHESWQWQIYCPSTPGGTDCIDTTVQVPMYDIDGFDNTAAMVASLHAQGRKVICYIDAGTKEGWRPDAAKFPASVVGKPLDPPWNDQWWLDVRQISIIGPIEQARMDMCRSKGFDGIQFDDITGWQEDSGFHITPHDQLVYNTWLANQAHLRGLSAAFENDIEQVPTMVMYYDWAIFEECNFYQECNKALPFVQAGKFVGETEYRKQYADLHFCPAMASLGYNAMFKHRLLSAYRVPCPP